MPQSAASPHSKTGTVGKSPLPSPRPSPHARRSESGPEPDETSAACPHRAAAPPTPASCCSPIPVVPKAPVYEPRHPPPDETAEAVPHPSSAQSPATPRPATLFHLAARTPCAHSPPSASSSARPAPAPSSPRGCAPQVLASPPPTPPPPGNLHTPRASPRRVRLAERGCLAARAARAASACRVSPPEAARLDKVAPQTRGD